MSNPINLSKKKGWPLVLGMLGLIAVSVTLRAPLTSVGPIVDWLEDIFMLSSIETGLLTSIPLITWSLFSVLIGALSVRYKIENVIFLALILLSTGLLLRISGSITMLFAGTAIIGLAICIGNVLIPAFVKKQFPGRLGLMTGIYTVAMNTMAAIASAYARPIGEASSWHWKAALGIWVVFALLAILFWIPQLYQAKKKASDAPIENHQKINVFHSRIAWSISVTMGLQSLMFYTIVAWFPKILMDYGVDSHTAGWVLSYFLLATLPSTFIGPIVADRMKNQKPLIWLVALLMMLGVGLIIVYKAKYVVLGAVLLGLSNGLAFSISMLFFSLRTNHPKAAVQVSGMAQSVGYLIAAFGPAIFGTLYDWTGGWNTSFYFLFSCAFVVLYFGLYAAGDRKINN